MKTYSAQSGYVYNYFFEGYSPYNSAQYGAGVEFVFSLSSDRKNWYSLSVFQPDAGIRAWENSHSRALSATERYAIAKMALFKAFDERESPAAMRQNVHTSAGDVDAIIGNLGL